MSSVIQFFNDSWHEITNEVTWPSWSSLQSSATLVLIASIIFALIVGGMDFLITNALEFLLKSI
jgi:preprotein translocase subunit SecE